MRIHSSRPVQTAVLLLVCILVFSLTAFFFGCAGSRAGVPDGPGIPGRTDIPPGSNDTAVPSPVKSSWLRGDLHCHTTHSDGDSGVAEVIARAEEAGLDFLAITDHDTSMAGKPSHWYDPAFRSERLILLYGVEWTSAKGHGNVFASAPFAYAPLWKANRECDAEAAVEAAHRQGAYFSINHPKGMVGSWQYVGLCGADFIEIWNAPFYLPSRNRLAIEDFWQEKLYEGSRIPAVGGSDNHQLKGYQRNINPHGHPATWVFAEEPTPAGILGGMKAGRVTISAGPETGRLELAADTNGDGVFETMMGDAVHTGKRVTLKISFIRSQGEEPFKSWETYDAVIFKNGRPFLKSALRPARKPWVTVTDLPEEPGFYRAELYGTPRGAPAAKALMGETLAVTNPIYIGNR